MKCVYVALVWAVTTTQILKSTENLISSKTDEQTIVMRFVLSNILILARDTIVMYAPAAGWRHTQTLLTIKAQSRKEREPWRWIFVTSHTLMREVDFLFVVLFLLAIVESVRRVLRSMSSLVPLSPVTSTDFP